MADVLLLIANAKLAIMNAEYDDTQTYDANKNALDSIVEQLRKEIAMERLEDIEYVTPSIAPRKIIKDNQTLEGADIRTGLTSVVSVRIGEKQSAD